MNQDQGKMLRSYRRFVRHRKPRRRARESWYEVYGTADGEPKRQTNRVEMLPRRGPRDESVEAAVSE